MMKDSFDLDLDSDPIKEYLIDKLKEIKAINQNLEESLKSHPIDTKNIKENSENSTLSIGKTWKKLVNDHAVLGMETSGIGDKRSIENVFIYWDSKIPIDYKISWIESNLLLIVIKIPEFSDKLSYKIKGMILYGDDTIDIPPMDLSAGDLFDNSLSIDIYTLIEGLNIEDLFVYCAASEVYELFMILPPLWNRTLDSLFEIDYSLNKIKNKDGNYYIVHRISPNIDGTIIKAEQYNETIAFINIYSKNHHCVLNLLHYLYRLTNNIKFLPKQHFHPIKDFKCSFKAEVEFMKNFNNNLDIVDHQSLTDLALKNQQSQDELKLSFG